MFGEKGTIIVAVKTLKVILKKKKCYWSRISCNIIYFIYMSKALGISGKTVLPEISQARASLPGIRAYNFTAYRVVCPNFGRSALTVRFTHFIDAVGKLRK